VQNQFFLNTDGANKKIGNKRLGVETPPRRRIDRGYKETIEQLAKS
jgi:hypothetical protein